MDISALIDEYKERKHNHNESKKEVNDAIIVIKEILSKKIPQATLELDAPRFLSPKDKGEFDKCILTINSAMKGVSQLIRMYIGEINNTVMSTPIKQLPEVEGYQTGTNVRGDNEDSVMRRIIGVMRKNVIDPHNFKSISMSPVQKLIKEVELTLINWRAFVRYYRKVAVFSICFTGNEWRVQDLLDFFYEIEGSLLRMINENVDHLIDEVFQMQTGIATTVMKSINSQQSGGGFG